MAKVAIVYHSGYGHTAVLADRIAEGVRDTGADAAVFQIENAAQDFGAIFDGVADADAIVFGSPTYMGDVSAAFKAFEEASSRVFGAGGWKDKLAGGFTVSHSTTGDKGHTMDSLATFAGQHSMVWVSLGIPGPTVPFAERDETTVNRLGAFSGLLAQADNVSPEISPPAGDRETARLYGERIARAAIRWASGAAAPAVPLAA